MDQKALRAVIVEDHPVNAETLRHLLGRTHPGIAISGVYPSVVSAAKALKLDPPDIVFLDVELEGGTGFDLLEILGETPFALIFTTASDDHAVRAFRFAAIDYLLKPVGEVELAEAVSRAVNSVSPNREQLTMLQAGIDDSTKVRKLALHAHDRIDFVGLDQIIRCEADGNYTHFFLSDGRNLLVTRTLKEYDGLLVPAGFLRVHQSHLVNIRAIRSFHKHDGGYLELQNGEKIPVSTRRRAYVVQALDSLGP